MSRVTLGLARAKLQKFCGPNGAASADVPDNVNIVSAWMLSHEKFRGSTQKVVFQIYDDQVTLPRNLLTILGASIQGVGDNFRQKTRYSVRNEWYEFIPGSSGIAANPPWDVVDFEAQGDYFMLFRNLPSAGHLKIYATTTEAGSLNFAIRGISGGAKVFTGTGTNRIEGELLSVPVTNGAFTLSSQIYDAGNSVYSIVKPSTNGVITIYHVSLLDGTETLIGQYEPGETLPCYRRYLIPKRCNDSGQLVAFCKLRHVDVIADNDEVYPGNLNALEMGLQALNFRRKQDMGRADEWIGRAVDELNSEIEEFTAEESWGTMQIEEDVGMGSVPNLL